MCGIFGYFCKSQVSTQKVLKLLRILEEDRQSGETSPVGGHGAGVCFLNDFGKFVVYKVGKTNSSPAEDLSLIRDVVQAKSRIILAHVRHASPEFMNTIKYAEATQPYKVNCLGLSEVVSAHNGKVRNTEKIKKHLSKRHCYQSEETLEFVDSATIIDSEVIPHLFEENLTMYSDEVKAGKKTWQTLEGNNATVLLSLTGDTRYLHLLHKGHSRGMHVWKNNKGEIILCSRENPLQQTFGHLLKEGHFEKIISIEHRVDKELCQKYKLVDLKQHRQA